VSCVVEVVDRVHTNGQGVEENPPTNQVEKVVTHILIDWNPMHGRGRRGRRETMIIYANIARLYLCEEESCCPCSKILWQS
jgi:hypothetical protein